MSKRERRRSRLDRDAVEENERFRGSSSKPVVLSDDEANEDLSLQIIEKALLMRAAKLFPDKNGVAPLERAGIEDSQVSASRSKKSATKKVVKKKKVKKTETEDKDDIVINEVEDKPQMVEETSVAVESNPAKDTDNLVLRKLLRGPRYFDPPDSSWGACYNCGEEGHAAVNCTSARRIKPCFVCGSLEHNVKQCTKGQDCYICKKTGHRAKDCPDKYKSISATSKICLKCGDSGHDMSLCRSDYDLEDLKEICCYVCKKLGHLCCANYVDSCPKEVSCYRCGQMGHTGLLCTRKRGGEASYVEQVSSCFKCGEEGHFARECTKSSSKNGKRNREPSTPTLKPHREHRHDKGHKSAPHDLGKGGHKKKKTQHEESSYNTPRKPKQRGGWITEDPGDYSYDRKNYGNDWRSPNGNRTPYMRNGGYVSTPNSYDNWTHYPHGNQEYHGQGYHRFQNSRSRNSRTNEFPWTGYPNGGSNGGGRNSRNYGW